MAQQQQTVLRVQTNKPNPDVIVPIGTLSVLTGSTNTTGVTYGGSGTVDAPYTGVTSAVDGLITFKVNDTDGIFNYSINGSGYTAYLYVNGIAIDQGTGTLSDTINVYTNDIIQIDFAVTNQTFNVSFTPQQVIVYQNLDLDLYTDIPIKINKSFAEIQDIAKRNSDYSIGLQLPGSKKNNEFFEGYYNVDNITLYFDVTKRTLCQVLINDQSYFRGYLRLNKVSVLNSKVEYDVTLYSTVADIFGLIGNNLMKDLDYNDSEYPFNHTFDKFSVQNWDYSIFSYDDEPLYFYPVVHNGYNYSGETVLLSGVTDQTRLYTSTIVSGYSSNAAAYAAGVKRYRINSPEDGLIDNQLKPALNVKALIELIFKTYGYSIDSDFFNTPWFRLLYLYGYFSSDTTKFSFRLPPPQTLNVEGVTVYPDAFSVPNTISLYVVKANTGIPCLCSQQLTMAVKFFDQFYLTYNTQYYTIPAGSTGLTINYGYPNLIEDYVDAESTVPYSYVTLAYSPSLPINSNVPFDDGDFVDFSLVIDEKLKQIDFLNSIAKKFNLVFIPDPNIPNKIIIEPYQFYIGTGQIYDWTNKLSFDKGFSVEPAQNFIESELILTDLEDGDDGNKIFKDRNNRIYGESYTYKPGDFKSQTKKIETLFSPELIRKWDTEATAPNGDISLPLGINYAMQTVEQTSGDSSRVVNTYKGVKTKPKLFYHLGYYNPFLDTYGEVFNFSGNVLTNGFYVTESDGSNPRISFTAPIISHTMPVGNPDSNKINNDSICNLFNSELPTDVGVSTYNVYTENDVFSLFYENRVTNLYDKNTRFLSGYFYLKLSDIINLQPKDLIKINEQYFTWNKIDSYNMTNPELTKVELVQVNNTISEYPTRYFKYFYCDSPSSIYKFQTDFTNPSLSGTSYGWSIQYDYNIGILGGAASGYTSCVRDVQATVSKYVPYYIYEVSQTDYNTGGSGRTNDSLWMYTLTGQGDLNLFNYPPHVYNSGSTKQIFNVFEDCADFGTYQVAYGILTGSSTYHSSAPSIYSSGITINVTDTGWIKYNTASGTVYEFISSTGNYDITNCADCSSVTVGIPYADLATFTIVDCGTSC